MSSLRAGMRTEKVDSMAQIKIIYRYKQLGYTIDVMRQSACLVINQIKVNNFIANFDCTTAGRP